MKKLSLLVLLLGLSACYDAVQLGYADNIGVFYNSRPQNCQQVGMTLLSSGIWTSHLESEIERLREVANQMQGNYVDIQNYDYQAGLTTFNTNHMTAVIYRCPDKK